MLPGAVRTELHIPRHRVAEWAGVSEQLIALYEARSTAVVSEARRARIDAVYQVLGEALTKLRRR